MNYLHNQWQTPENIMAVTTTRIGGISSSPYASNNIALHVGDDATAVNANRQSLSALLHLPGEPAWLEQTHSSRCIVIEEEASRSADAAITRTQDTPLAIMTADCLPILLCDKNGTEIAAIHAGWRGLVNGIVENTLIKLQQPMANYYAWIGPAICQNCYNVGDEVIDACMSRYSFANLSIATIAGKMHVNLPKLAELILYAYGIRTITQSNICTFEAADQFYSYRRDGKTGRMVSLIWFKGSQTL